MRHKVYGKHLGRDKDQRATLFKGLVQQLFIHGSIQTSEAKAKAIKGLVDKVINLAKNKKIYRFGLTKEILPKLGSRTSGYTSLVKLGTRLGDQAMMVKMSLIGAERLSVPSSQLSDKSKSVVSESVTDKQRTDKPKSENRKPKTDNRNKKVSIKREK